MPTPASMKTDERHSHPNEPAETAAHPADAGHGGHDEDDIALPEVPKPRAGTLIAIGAVGLSLLGGLFLLGLVPRLKHDAAVREETAQRAGSAPKVTLVKPKRRASAEGFKLPGQVQALEDTTVFARTSGYLKKRYVDIGDTVTEGQLLAELETPEADQELAAAQATLAQSKGALESAKAQAEFSRVSIDRYRELVKASLASKQDVDQREAQARADAGNVRAASSLVESNQANVRRLLEIKAFARVVAPFAGKVTARKVDLGALVTAGNGTGQALFKVTQLDPVRVFVSVPQAYAPFIRSGGDATILVREYPGRNFVGKVTRTAGALDPGSRTMLTEIQVPNPDNALLPGMYAQLKVERSGAPAPFAVPATALIAGADGTRVAIVDASHNAHLRKVVIGDDYGMEVGVTEGLEGDEDVVANPGERVAEGVLVEVLAAGAPPPAAPPAHGK